MNEQKVVKEQKKIPIASDLAELIRPYDEKQLEEAISIGDRPAIIKYLRKLSDHLSPDIVNKLADYLDPDRRGIKSGPKPKKKRSWMFRNQVIGFYLSLCKDREIARFFLNRDNEAFFLVENSEIFDADGNFAPQWKYPLSKRKREAVPFPKRGDIKPFVCEMYNIGSRTFDDLLAAYRK